MVLTRVRFLTVASDLFCKVNTVEREVSFQGSEVQGISSAHSGK